MSVTVYPAPVQPISGTVTANAGTNLDTSTLSTAAKQDTQSGYLDGLEALLSAIQTAVETLDNAIAGSEMQVDIVGALPAGTAAIGKLAANSGVDIGDVDVTSVPADPFGANADAAVAAGATGSIQAKLRRATQGLEDLKTLIVLATGSNLIGRVSVEPQTANGLSVLNATSSDGGTALTSTAQVIKATAGQVYGWYIYNPNAAAAYVLFYNVAAGSVTVGTTNPLFMLTLPAGSAANVEFTNGIPFSNAGFSIAAASTAGGNGAPTTALDAVIFYK